LMVQVRQIAAVLGREIVPIVANATPQKPVAVTVG
jgi:hypothetical protein